VGGFSAQVNDDGKIAITKADGGSFTLTETVDANADTTEDAASVGLAEVTNSATTFRGQISLDSTSDITLSGSGLVAAGLDSVGNTTTTIDQVNVLTVAGATTAISSVDAALKDIATIRGDLGAVQNRFESTIANLMNVSENISAARSRILDADFAAETANLTKSQILQQAGLAMLSQANQIPQAALTLLQG
jgi:flagellin